MYLLKGKKKQEAEETATKAGNLDFVKAVARYFMDFLETDFHKRRSPKRYIKYRDKDNLLIGLNLKEYESFCSVLWTAINDSFSGKTIKIRKGVYQTPVPKDLLELIRIYCNRLTQEKLDELARTIASELEASASTYEKDYDEAFKFALIQTSAILKSNIVLPLIEYLERPLEKMREADENTVFILEEELTEGLVNFVDNKISQILNLLIQKEPINPAEELPKYFKLAEVRSFIQTFFDNFRVTDLFTKLYELHRNRNILDKQDFYLYFGDISFEKVNYPIFYIPFKIETAPDTLVMNFDSRVYLNKKVLDYIQQQYNSQTGKKGSFKVDSRIIYLAQSGDSFADKIQQIFSDILNCFELDQELNIKDPSPQVCKSLLVKVSNRLYINLFDKSDEAIINDYEEILNLEPESILVQAFDKLLDDFIHKNPEAYENEVEQEWDELEVEERLVFRTPIPLNKEQYKVISALAKDDCRYVIVEGPPGTGKSHSITAIVFNAILNGQSVLVLSDKKEALDVVEDKISSTMDKIRIDKNFQNPILRLGHTGSTYNQILSSSSISRIEDNVKAVRKDVENLHNAVDQNLDDVKEALEAEIESYSHIDFSKIIEAVQLRHRASHLKKYFNLEELESLANVATELDSLRANINQIQNDFSGSSLEYDISHRVSEETLEASETLCRLVTELVKLRQQLGADTSYPPYSYQALEEFENEQNQVEKILKNHSEWVKFSQDDERLYLLFRSLAKTDTESGLQEVVEGIKALIEVGEKIRTVYGGKTAILEGLESVLPEHISKLREFSSSFIKLRHWLFGYLGKSEELGKLTIDFKKSFPEWKLDRPHRHRKALGYVADIVEYALELKSNVPQPFVSKICYLDCIVKIVTDKSFAQEVLPSLVNRLESVIQSWRTLGQPTWRKELREQSRAELERVLLSAKFFQNSQAIAKSYNKISSIVTVGNLLPKSEFTADNLFKCKLDELLSYLEVCLDFFRRIWGLRNTLSAVSNTLSKIPKSAVLLEINPADFRTLLRNSFDKIENDDFEGLLRYLSLREDLQESFNGIDPVNYFDCRKEIEELVTAQMTYLMDERVVNFTRNYKSEARVLRQIIRAKKQFPREQFTKLKEAFPCILSGIRDYAEYIPLEPEIFDLVIIDEASQVSVAQAFPALLRAKKVLVLGDQKQFSNVKSAHARTDYNKEHLNKLEEVFRKNISEDLAKIEKLKKFNIKTSILDFFEFINNYRARLLKHFRGYKEIISYSNKHFYQQTLQVMKIRGRPVGEVLKFTVLNHDGKVEPTANTNMPEIEFIVSELKKLFKAKKNISVGIITPHTNQQKLINEKINELPERDFYFDHLKLKIMTFDTCQGEERDLIFYSMVATKEDDKLNYIFIKDLSKVDLEEEGMIRAQRLNVGFSRAKECMHFVLSKAVERYSGEIGNALNFYQQQLIEAQKERDISEVDPRSKMEEKILHYFYQTKFWQKNKERIELTPQFEIGEYLKQLDPSYDHPKYRVDFLLFYTDSREDIHRIVIEYDGFHEHFKGAEGIGAQNYEHYYSDEDVYRQKVLQGYGYKFLRINRFNIGDNPIETLNDRLEELVAREHHDTNILTRIKKKIVGLGDGSLKQCPKCKEVLPHDSFYDKDLVSKYGRFCQSCKAISKSEKREYSSSRKKEPAPLTDQKCPRCGSQMRLRNGKYGKFYGCSRFPRCRGTRRY